MRVVRRFVLFLAVLTTTNAQGLDIRKRPGINGNPVPAQSVNAEHSEALDIGIIEGRVFDGTTGEPQRDVEVTLDYNRSVAKADANGRFRFDKVRLEQRHWVGLEIRTG